MKPSFVIFADKVSKVARVQGSELQIFPTALATDELESEWAKSIREALHLAKYDGSVAALIIPSLWCVAASIPIGDLPKRNRRALMTYRLEEQLPIAAEELVIDFAISKPADGSRNASEEQALGVGTGLSKLDSLVKALEIQGIYVQSISTSAILATQHLIQNQDGDQRMDVCVWKTTTAGSDFENEPTFELVEICSGSICGWSTAYDVDSLMVQLRRLYLVCETQLHVQTVGFLKEDESRFATLMEAGCLIPRSQNNDTSQHLAGNISFDAQANPVVTAAAFCAAAVLKAEIRAAIEFRRDVLAPPQPLRRVKKPLAFAVAALIALSCITAASMLALARAYDMRTSNYQALERSFYREAESGQIPSSLNVTSLLLREDRRLQALSGTVGSSGTSSTGKVPMPVVPLRRSALTILDDILTALPRNLRFRILEMQISPDQLQLDGQARTHGDADAIADGLRSSGVFVVDPPHSELHGNSPGVSFTIMAKVADLTPTSGRSAKGAEQ